MSNPIYLALDLPQIEPAKALLKKVKSHIGGVKLGLEFFCSHGHHGVHDIAHLGLPIFLDLKLHDIPNTVAGAMQAIFGRRISSRSATDNAFCTMAFFAPRSGEMFIPESVIKRSL